MRPNILFLFSDQQHWEALGRIDSSFTTPNQDRFAEGGTVFSHAFCTSPQCSPSRSSMLTGQFPSKTGVLGNVGSAGGDPLRSQTIGAMLQAAGYRTGYFGKWHLGQEPCGLAGWDDEDGLGDLVLHDDSTVTNHAAEFLRSHSAGGPPFALFLSFNNPHDVYHFSREKDPRPQISQNLPETWHRQDFSTVPAIHEQFLLEDQGQILTGQPPAAWQRYRELYREKVALYDREVGAVLDALKQSGLEESTLMVVTSDHGDMDGQHRLIYKGPFLYEHMVRIPLAIRLPAALQTGKTPATTDFLSSNVDLVPTLADFAGIQIPATDGVSLRPLLTGEGPIPEREFVIGQYYSKQKWINPIRMIRTKRFKYNRYLDWGEELYDLENDPGELSNLTSLPQWAAEKARLARMLDAWMAENDDPFYTQYSTERDGTPLVATLPNRT